MFQVRPFEPRDRESILALRNRDRPEHRHQTVAAWEHADTRRKPELADLRLCVGDPAFAYLRVWDRGTESMDTMENVCEFEVDVAPEYRGQGIGGLLYEKAVDFARERGAKRLLTHFHEDSPQEPAIQFLQQRGFAELERESYSFLNLAAWDSAPFTPFLVQAAAYGVRLASFDEIGDTEASRRLFYELQKELIYDIPRRDTQPFTFEPYDDWAELVLGQPTWRPDLCVVALRGDEWIGQTHLLPKQGSPQIAMQWLTGVRQPHRGHGLATALKVCAYERAQAVGIVTVATENHDDNAPMLAINQKFGFQTETPLVIYNKILREP